MNGKPVPKVVVLSGGTLKLYEKLIDQVTTITKLSQYQSWFMLGFGASGKELEEKWDIKYLGPEKIDGVTTQKLEMVAKDANVRKNIPKVTVWMDTDRGVSLQQVFDQGGGQPGPVITPTSRSISVCRGMPSPSRPTSRPGS